MPELLIFAPCEKILVDNMGNPTLIAVLQNINVEIDSAVEIEDIPVGAVVPKDWAIFVLWKPSIEEAGKSFVQVIKIVLSDGTLFRQQEQPFTFKSTDSQSNILNVMGFPIGKEGPLQLQLSLNDIPNSEITFNLYVKYAQNKA